MRLSFLMWIAAGMLLTATLSGRAQDPMKSKDVEKRKTSEKVNGKTYYEWVKDLKDKDPSIQEHAVAVLKVYGTMAQDDTKEIVKLLSPTQRDVSLKVNAIITLGYIGIHPQYKEDVVG